MLTPLQVITDMGTKQLERVDSLDWLAVKHHRRYADLGEIPVEGLSVLSSKSATIGAICVLFQGQ